MQNDQQPWTLKYRPSNLDDFVGIRATVDLVREFLDNFPKGHRGLILAGPPGCGKTSIAHAAAKERKCEIIEMNAADVRNKDAIISRLGPAMQQMSLFGGSKIILVDEIDGVSGTKDRGGAAALASLIKEAKFPVICTANDGSSKKLKPLRKVCDVHVMHGLKYTSIANILKSICSEEGIQCDEETLSGFARRVDGDARGAINDLQMIAAHDKKIDDADADMFGNRRKVEQMQQALIKVFKTLDGAIAKTAFDDVEENPDDIGNWLEENIPAEYKDREDLANALDMLSIADVFSGRIRRQQYWRYLATVMQIWTVGIALAKKEKYKGFTSYRQTTRFFAMWRAKQKRATLLTVCSKIGERCHISPKVAEQVLPYVALMTGDRELAEQMTLAFDFNKEEASWLATRGAEIRQPQAF